MEMRFDTENAAVAVSVMGRTLLECRSQWAAALASGADLVEWRLDYLEEKVTPGEVAALAKQMRAKHGLPVLATYRTVADGGRASFASTEAYQEVVTAAAKWADLVDVEVSMPESAQIIQDLVPVVAVVASFHDFTSEPSADITKQLLGHMAELGVSVGKVAWMVRDEGDLALVQSMQVWAVENVAIPSVVIGMGDAGTASRLGESARISAFTFARGVGSRDGASAPGQPTVQEIRASVSC